MSYVAWPAYSWRITTSKWPYKCSIPQTKGLRLLPRRLFPNFFPSFFASTRADSRFTSVRSRNTERNIAVRI